MFKFLQKRTYLVRKHPPQFCSADEAVKVIKSHDRVYVHGVAAVPSTLLKGLLEISLENFLIHSYSISET
jgi:hypothetical protein